MKYQSINGAVSVTWNGETYKPNRKGVFDLPAEALEDVAPHGIVPLDESAPAPAASADGE